MASVSPNPNLGKSQALNVAQNTVSRLATIVPSLTTQLSPVTVYQPGATGGVGNELVAWAGQPVDVNGSYGVWVAPDFLGNGQEYYVQVECFGAGGGGGGGSSSAGGGGGGGGEYACENQYPVKPGQSYGYVVGLPGTGGVNNSTQINPGAAGTNGGTTLFDTDHNINLSSLANGVVAYGGQGGDQNGIGIGGVGGTGSPNAIAFDGGTGGTGYSSASSDSPMALSRVSGMFVGNTLSDSIVLAWYILNETGTTGGQVNDQSLNVQTAAVTNYGSGIGMALGGFSAPTQVPAYASPAEPPDLPVATQAGKVAGIGATVLTHYTSKVESPDFGLRTTSLFTVSCWIQCDPSGTWGNTANGSYAVIATNNDNFNGNALTGYTLFLHQDGTPGAPSWSLHGAVGNGSSRTIINYTIGQTPGNWYYVVMTYNSGTLTLYVNNTAVGTATSSGYTSIPTGQYGNNMLGSSVGSSTNWFFGSICNVWWAKDCATATLVAQVYASSPPTGGAGGGASGGPSAVGGTGGSAAGSVGGTAGTPATQPASLAATTTEAMSGYPGANAGSGFMLHGLKTTFTTVTKTVAGTYSQTLPEGVTTITSAACWGAGSGGAGGTTTAGGAGGGGGEYAAEATYTPLENPFSYTVGLGGTPSSTGNGAGGNGGDSFIDSLGVYGNGASGSTGGTGSANTTHHNGGAGGAASAFTGGASGGNSGNATATGNSGTSSSSSTHAGAPAGQSGSGTGGAGSDANTGPATSGGSPGAGGGGAGAGTSSKNTLTKTYEAVYTASYYGPDAEGGNQNQLRSTSTLYQGGETSGGGGYNGNQRCVMVFNSNQIAADFAGYTATGISLKLTNQHSWYNSGMTVEIDVGGGKYPGSAPGTWLGNQFFGWTTTIAEGATHTYALSASVAAQFINNEINFLGLGAYVAADHPYNLSYYGYFAGGHGTALEITITGTQSTAGSEDSGAGSDGEVTFTYANQSPYTPPAGTTGGPYGGGGGGSGDMAASPALTVLTVPFSSAAAYSGVDAANAPGTPYSINLDNNPNSGVNSVLFAGGAATDTGTGSKNSILLVPAGLQAMLKNGSYTVEQVFITFTNAFANNPVEPILELGYSADTSLPQTYSGESLASYIGAIPIPAGSTTVTYDLTQSGIGQYLQTGAATALVIGPGATPTFDAYNAPYGPGFYCSIYGPGAYDGFGNAQYPYLTIVLQKTLTYQKGSSGAGGAIIITAINNSNVPVSNVQPYATTDEAGNQFAQGYTGPVVAFDPTKTTPGSFVPETWKPITLDSGWTAVAGQPPMYRILPHGSIEFSGAATHTAFSGTVNVNSSNPLSAPYRPVSNHYVRTSNGGTVADTYYTTTGVIQALGSGTTIQVRLDGTCSLI